jgi:hypothetical protein
MLRFTRWGVFLTLFLVACSPSVSASRILVEWKTASELNTAGFNLYRGESPDGPFVQLNTGMISASPDPVIGGEYRYLDTDVTVGKTYYYQLEDVELGGTSTRHGPISITAPFMFLDNITTLILALVLGGLVIVGLGVFYRHRRSKI